MISVGKINISSQVGLTRDSLSVEERVYNGNLSRSRNRALDTSDREQFHPHRGTVESFSLTWKIFSWKLCACLSLRNRCDLACPKWFCAEIFSPPYFQPLNLYVYFKMTCCPHIPCIINGFERIDKHGLEG